MAIDKIELHEVSVNSKQISEAAETIKLLQDDLEHTLEEYNDAFQRFSNGEISRKEFSDLTRSKNEHVSSIKEKMNEHFKVFGKSITTLTSVLSRAKRELSDATKSRKMKVKKKKKRSAPVKQKKKSKKR